MVAKSLLYDGVSEFRFGVDIADLFFSFTNFDVRIQNSGAVATAVDELY